jgi:hypothetical protein
MLLAREGARSVSSTTIKRCRLETKAMYISVSAEGCALLTLAVQKQLLSLFWQSMLAINLQYINDTLNLRISFPVFLFHYDILFVYSVAVIFSVDQYSRIPP